MNPFVQNVSLFLAMLTAASQVGAIVGILFFYLGNKKAVVKFITFFSKNYLKLALTVALTATLGSLFYSEIAGFTPCKLCWFERILMYPQTILFAIALWKKDAKIWIYSLTLSLIGAVISFYHYLMQIGFVPEGSCDAVGKSVSCSKIFTMTFGYITIPLMAGTAFVLLILMAVAVKKGTTKNS